MSQHDFFLTNYTLIKLCRDRSLIQEKRFYYIMYNELQLVKNSRFLKSSLVVFWGAGFIHFFPYHKLTPLKNPKWNDHRSDFISSEMEGFQGGEVTILAPKSFFEQRQSRETV